MSSDIYVEWVNRDAIRVLKNNLMNGHSVIYEGPLTSEVQQITEGLGSFIPEKPQMTDEELAIALHDSLCRHNHTDMCSWMYEIHGDVADWNSYAHRMWLNNAHTLQKMLPDYKDTDMIKVVKAIKGMV